MIFFHIFLEDIDLYVYMIIERIKLVMRRKLSSDSWSPVQIYFLQIVNIGENKFVVKILDFCVVSVCVRVLKKYIPCR